MSRRAITLIVLVNLLLLVGIVWVLWPRADTPAPVPVAEQTETTYTRPTRTTPRAPDKEATTEKDVVRVGTLSARIPAGYQARSRVYGKAVQVLFVPDDAKSRNSAAILMVPRTQSLGRRVRDLVRLSPQLTDPPRIVRLRSVSGVAGEVAAFSITDRRVKTARTVILINRGRQSLSVEAMGPRTQAARVTDTALDVARSLRVG